MCPSLRLSPPSSAGIGVGLVGFGLFFIFFGMLLYFDSVLLAFGNVSTVGPGVPAAGADAQDGAKGPSGQDSSDPLPSSSQILFLSGLVFIIGFRRTFTFFFQRQKLKGTSFFLGGVLIVLMRWPLLGMLLEGYGFIILFRSVPQPWPSRHGVGATGGRVGPGRAPAAPTAKSSTELNGGFCFNTGVFSRWLLGFWVRWQTSRC